MNVVVVKNRTKAIATLLLLLPSYHCHNCTWLLFFNDDEDNKHKIKKLKERNLKDLKERMFNDLSLGFEGVEDYMRMKMMVIALNN